MCPKLIKSNVVLALAVFSALLLFSSVPANADKQIITEPVNSTSTVLDQILNLQQTAQGTIEINTLDPKTLKQKSGFTSGDRMILQVEIPEPGALYVFDIDPTGKTMCLFPNKWSEDNWIEKPGVYTLGLGDTKNVLDLGTRNFKYTAKTDSIGYDTLMVVFVSQKKAESSPTILEVKPPVKPQDSLQNIFKKWNVKLKKWFKKHNSFAELVPTALEFVAGLKGFYEMEEGVKQFVVEPMEGETADPEIAIQLPVTPDEKKWFGYKMVLMRPSPSSVANPTG